MKILGIAGSLRAGSYNKALLRVARDLAPAGTELVEFDVRHLPHYDGVTVLKDTPIPKAIALGSATNSAFGVFHRR